MGSAASPAATRRQALGCLGAVSALAVCPAVGGEAQAAAAGPTLGRDRPFSDALSEETRHGRYHCRGCGHALFDAHAKSATSTGWPSFSAALPGAVRSSAFLASGAAPLACAACALVLGDVIAIRPLRYSVDGSALLFLPAPDAAVRIG